MKNKHNPLLEMIIYIIVYILFFGFAFLLLMLILDTFNRPALVEGEGWVTVAGVIASSVLAYAALKQSHTANLINERLMKIEISRDQQALIPFVLIGDGSAGRLPQYQVLDPHKTLMIDIGGEPVQEESGNLMYYAMTIEYINTTDYPLRLHYESMISKDQTERWHHGVANNGMYGILMKPGESKKILFYGDKSKFANPNGYEMKLILENRFTERYIETVTLYIVGYTAGSKDSPNFVQLRSQNYHVEKVQQTCVFDSEKL